MTLQDWLNSGWLKPHKSSANEVKVLIAKVDRDIAEAEKPDIVLDWRLAIAYNACLGCATIALRASGYRIPGGTGQHYRTIQSLRFTLKPPEDLISSLEGISKKRGIVSYDEAGTISEAQAEEAILLAKDLKELLLSWIKENYYELLG
jgi:hypothetical protein